MSDTPEVPSTREKVSVAAALAKELQRLPKEMRESTLASLSMSLAINVDSGRRVPDAARELRQCLIKLSLEDFDIAIKDSGPDEIAKKREQRRNA